MQTFFILDLLSVQPIDYIILAIYGPQSDMFKASRCGRASFAAQHFLYFPYHQVPKFWTYLRNVIIILRGLRVREKDWRRRRERRTLLAVRGRRA